MVFHMARGDIVLVPFPFDHLASRKVRPALCLSDSISAHRHVLISMLKSTVALDLLPTDLVLRASDPQFSQTGLRVSSTVRLHRLLCVTESIFLRHLSIIPGALLPEIAAKLKLLFQLT